MQLARVIGRLVSTHKLDCFTGVKFLIIQPMDENHEAISAPIVACDTVQAGEGDIVFYETGREASIPLPDPFNPADATITAIVDQINQA